MTGPWHVSPATLCDAPYWGPERVTITAHGAAGLRSMSFPGDWTPRAPLEAQDGQWLLDYPGGTPLTVELEVAAPNKVN